MSFCTNLPQRDRKTDITVLYWQTLSVIFQVGCIAFLRLIAEYRIILGYHQNTELETNSERKKTHPGNHVTRTDCWNKYGTSFNQNCPHCISLIVEEPVLIYVIPAVTWRNITFRIGM